nr:hypothetical protein [Tanacetum cinerariifolium]
NHHHHSPPSTTTPITIQRQLLNEKLNVRDLLIDPIQMTGEWKEVKRRNKDSCSIDWDENRGNIKIRDLKNFAT